MAVAAENSGGIQLNQHLLISKTAVFGAGHDNRAAVCKLGPRECPFWGSTSQCPLLALAQSVLSTSLCHLGNFKSWAEWKIPLS